MARLAWQNVEAPNVAPAIQGFANVTTLLQKALESATANPMLESQIKQEELNAKIRKAGNDANTLAADRAINARVAISPNAQVLQQRLQNGSIFGEDYLDASPDVIAGARTAVGDMLTNSLNQDKVSALEPNRKIAWIRQQYAGDPVGYKKAMASMLSPETYAATPEAIDGIATGLTDAQTFGNNEYKQNQLESTDAIKKSANSVIGFALVGGGSKLDIRNNAFKRAYENNFNGQQLSVLADELKAAGIDIPDPIAQVPATTGGKTGSTPAFGAIAGAIPNIDNSGINSGSTVNLGILRNTFNNRPLPENINTIGDLFDNRQNEYFRGTDKELHTPTGPLQIIAGTFASHGKKIYGKNWREQSLNDPKVHYDIGESIFKEVGGNVDKLIGQWKALKKLPRSTVEQIAKGPWSQAAPIIAAAESGSKSGADRLMRQIGNPDYSNSQVSNVTSRASRAIAQFSADPLVVNYQTLNSSKLTADQVALDGIKTSVDFGSLNKDEMDLAARNIKRTIEYVQEQAGGNISPELAFAVAKQSFGDENFRTLWLNSDLNLNTTKMNKTIKSLNDKGGIPDQAAQLGKMTSVISKFEAANANVTALEKQLIDAKTNNGDNPYNTSISKAQAALDRALEARTKIAKEIENSSVFQPKENVTVEQKLANAAEEKKALVDTIVKDRLNLKAADDFVRTGKRTPASDAVAQSLQVTNPTDVKPVAAPIPVPIKVDGKAGTGTTFALDNKTGQTVPVTPLKLDPNVKYLKPVTVVKADRSGGQKGVITYVGDGDGANIDVGGSTIKCRLDTFDAPETGGIDKKWFDQSYGRESLNKLQSLIASGEVTVIVSKPADTNSPPSGKNNYGRSLCKIEVQGVNVDQEMLRSGAAWLRMEYATDEKLINLFNTAKANKVGLFANPNAVAPWDYRKMYK